MATVAVVTTTDTEKEAQAIATGLVEDQLAACVQISAIESHYVWEGKLVREREYRLWAKTTDAQAAAVTNAIVARHSYDVPAVYTLPLTNVHGPYAEWVETSVR